MSGMKAPSLWIVSVPGKRRQHEVMALTIEQAVGLVAGAAGSVGSGCKLDTSARRARFGACSPSTG